jgi:hypothetical protein
MGLLNAELNIPLLSWLYQWLFGQPLTVLNAITLIVAIPVTMVYRVSQGSYPFANLATQSTQPGGALDIGTNTILRGTFRAILALMIGIARAIADTLDVAKVFDPAKAPVLGKFLFGPAGVGRLGHRAGHGAYRGDGTL